MSSLVRYESWKVSSVVPLLVAISLATLPGCSSKPPDTNQNAVSSGGIQLKGAGSTFSSILFKSWFNTFHGNHPNVVVTYDVVGSGEGVRRFIGQNVADKDKVDFGASDSAMSDGQLAMVSKGVVMVPVTAGGIVLAYNLPGFKGELKLSREAYAGIFLGHITNWNDLRITKSNPGVKFPDLTIVTVVRQDSSGTTFAFTKHLDAISPEFQSKFGPGTLINWPGDAMRAPGNEGVAARIQQSVGSIGYIEYGFSRQLDLPVATLENRDGKYVKPAEPNFIAGLASAQFPENLRVFVPDPSGPNSYPIVSYSWVLLRKNNPEAEKAKMLRELFAWCVQDGQQYSSSLGYVQLPAPVAVKSLAALNNVGPQ
jgi:phosphate transport system substrate-binding protein